MILAFARFELSAADFETVAQHVESCGTCFELLEAIEFELKQPTDPAVGSLPGNWELSAPSPNRPETFAPVLTPPLSPGTVIDDWELVERCGSGSFGSVWKARDCRLNRFVAIKIPNQTHALDLEREARAAAQLDHQNVVRVLAVGKWTGSTYIVSEFVSGGTLDRIIQQGLTEPRRAAELCLGIARGLAHAHQAGVIHRDLKPSNVMLDDGSRPRLTDFGLARHAGEETIAVPGFLLGTPAYMSPEQAHGRADAVGPETDIYSLGVILFRLLTGVELYSGSKEGILQQIMNEPARPPRMLVPQLPLDLNTICLKCLEKVPSLRFRSATELGDELQRFLDRKPILSRPVGRLGQLRRWAQREPKWAITLTAIVFGSISFMVVIWTSWRREAVARTVAESRFQSAEDALQELAEVASEILHLPGGERRAQQLLTRVVTHYDTLSAASDQSEPTFLRDVGQICLLRARLEFSLQRATEAGAALNQARDAFTRLAQQPKFRNDARLGLAESFLQEAQMRLSQQQPDSAFKAAQQGREQLRQMTRGEQSRDERRTEFEALLAIQLGLASYARQELASAETYAQEACSLRNSVLHDPKAPREQRHSAIAALQLLARIQNAASQSLDQAPRREPDAEDAARHSIELAVRVAREWLGTEEADSTRMALLAETLLDAAEIARTHSRFADEERSLEEAQSMLEQLVERESFSPKIQFDLALTMTQRAQLAVRNGRNQAARALIEPTFDRLSELASLFPNHPEYALAMATGTEVYGEVLRNLSLFTEAHSLHEAAVERFESLIHNHPATTEFQLRSGISHSQLGQTLARLEKWEEAHQQLAAAIEILERLHADAPQHADYQQALADACMEAGIMTWPETQQASAEQWLRRSIELRRQIAEHRLPARDNLRWLVWLLTSSPLPALRDHAEAQKWAERLWKFEVGQESGLCVSILALAASKQHEAARQRLAEHASKLAGTEDVNAYLHALVAESPEEGARRLKQARDWHRRENPSVRQFELLDQFVAGTGLRAE